MENLIRRTLPYNTTNNISDLNYEMPRKCPFCEISIHPQLKGHTLTNYNQEYLQVFTWECPDCNRHYVTGHIRADKKSKNTVFLFIQPVRKGKEFPIQLVDLSPAFVKIYNQALHSEQSGHYEVAGMAFRKALEILIKDYAFEVLKKPMEEIESKNLSRAIEEYLPTSTHIAAADVVRIKGNDYSHYKTLIDDVSYEQMKFFFDALIDRIYTEIRLHNPPVSRNKRING